MPLRAWLNDVWRRTHQVEVLDGGEDGPAVGERRTLAVIDDTAVLAQVERLATTGDLVRDICRCPGDITLALYDEHRVLLGSATLHPGRVAWERERFADDLATPGDVTLRLVLAKAGVHGASRALLGRIIPLRDLHEGDVQFRRAGESSVRLPRSISNRLRQWSGFEAAALSQDIIDGLADNLIQAEGDKVRVIRQLLAWLGSVTWPAEAMAGDGQLARRMLDRMDQDAIVALLPEIDDPAEVMGAVVWAAYRDDDAGAMTALAGAIDRLFA